MNGAVIQGFEEDVGNRTSVYVHTAHSITASLAFYRKYGYTVTPHDDVLKSHLHLHVLFAFRHKIKDKLFLFFQQGIIYVMIPEGQRDFEWLQAVYKGERVASGEYKNRKYVSFDLKQY